MIQVSMRSLAWVVVAFAAASGASAQEEKPGLPPGDTCFTVKGQPAALERTFPGIVAALELSDEQRRGIAAARAETVDDSEVRAKGAAAKGNPAAAGEARKAAEDARAR